MSGSQIYQQVTDRIVSMLERGVRPWSQDWSAPGAGRPLRENGVPYRGANVLNLWMAALERGFSARHWMTYNKAAELGGQVKKGAKSERAFYVGTVSRTEERDGEEIERTIPFLKSYCVFNTDEIDGLPAQYYQLPPQRTDLDASARIPAAETFIQRTGAQLTYGGSRAFYRRNIDEIHIPDFAAFETAAGFYSTTLHELSHWTGAETRLDRSKGKVFGDPDYAFEELVAELSAAYLCADLAISNEPREDHASYIAGWLKALKDDNRNVFRAASHAEKAAAWLHTLQQPAEMQEAA
jgi:antirestriction protein ArdC